MLNRRNFAKGVLTCAALVLTQPGVGLAQEYPTKPIRLVTGSVTGGGGDLIARLLAKELTPVLGKSVFVENRPGAAQSIAADFVAKSPPDGYTLLLVPSTILATALRTDLPYDLEKDLTPISFLTTSAGVIVVNSKLPINSIKDLIAYAKARPGKLNYGSAGIASPGHLAGELFNIQAGTDIKHVPFKGGAEAAVAAAAGEIEIAYPGVSGTPALVDAGKVKALAVTTIEPVAALPKVPTLDKAGLPGFDFGSWHAVFAPAGIPPAVADKLIKAINSVIESGSLAETLSAQGYEPSRPRPVDQLKKKLHEDLRQTKEIGAKIGL
jgi:tripartite-type tricarboxylate transporter receptor subunit TctC